MTDSKGGAKAFIDQVDTNKAMQNQLQQAAANFVEVGKQHGYHFTQEELHDELRRRWEISKPKDDPDTCTVTAP